MMSSKNKSFTAGDMERYHSGKMLPQERHALEKAALDDPFLADALEGYAFTSTPADDLNKLKAKLDQKSERRITIPFFARHRWMNAAAVLLIIAGAGWFTYRILFNEKNTIAKQQHESKQQQDVTRIVEQQLSDTHQRTKPDDVALQNPQGRSRLKKPVVSKPEQDVVSNTASKMQYQKPVAIQTGKPMERVKKERDQTKMVEQSTNSRRKGNDRNEIAERNRSFVPDPGVNRNNHLITQPSTVFNNTNDSLSGDVANRKARNPDFTQSDTIKNFNVTLKEEKSTPVEVVVLDKTTGKEVKYSYPRVIIDTLEPAGGYVKFDDYVANNLKMPDELKDKTLAGEVQLSFEVDRKGQPVNITVVKSLCNKCDEEAIRLLKEGPKWKKKKNKKGRITIRF